MAFDQRGATITQANLPPVVNAVATPVRLLPPSFDALLDRIEPASAVMQAVGSKTVSAVNGTDGIGKTALLRYLCGRIEPSSYASGVVYFEQRGQPADDLLQSLFGAFYDAPPNFIPVGGALLRYLQRLQAFVIVDGLTMVRSDIDHLRAMAAGCTFLFAGDTVDLTEGRAVALAGLPEDAARSLVEARLGRVLDPAEQAATHDMWTRLAGNPLHLIQGAALVAQGRLSLQDLAARIAADGPGAVAAAAVAACSPDEKRLLDTLSGLGEEPVPRDAVTAIAGQTSAAGGLDALARRGLVQPHSPTFTTPANVKAALGQAQPGVAVSSVISWADHPANESLLLEAAPMLEHALEAAASEGKYQDVLTLARKLDGILAPNGRWGAWNAVLGRALDAARRLEDRVAEGWALHQLGSRSLALEDFGAARQLLNEALKARTAAKDAEGAAATKHNLGQVHALESAASKKAIRGNGSPPKLGGPPWGLFAVVGVALVLLATGGVAYALNPNVIGSLLPQNLATAAPASPSPTEAPSPTPIVAGPVIRAFKPSVFAQGASARVQVVGSGFQQGVRVDLGPGISVQRISMQGSEILLLYISVAPGASTGARDAVFTNPDGGQGTCSGCVTVNPAPNLAWAKPSVVYPSLGVPPQATTVVLGGSNFEPGAGVSFPGGYVTVLSSKVVSSTEIDVSIVVSQNAPPGYQAVVVSNPDGGRAQCNTCLSIGALIQ